MSELTREEYEASKKLMDDSIKGIGSEVSELKTMTRLQQLQLAELSKNAAKTNEIFEQVIKSRQEITSLVKLVGEMNVRLTALEKAESKRAGANEFKSFLLGNFKNIVLILGFLTWASYVLFFGGANGKS